MINDGVWWNIGCGDATLVGWVNLDRHAENPAVTQCDLEKPWPSEDSLADYIRAHDIIEHLHDKIFTMNEAWRVLKPGGLMDIVVPTTEGSGAFQDTTRVSFWNRRSFLYYEAGSPYRDRFAAAYGIKAKFLVKHEKIEQTVDGPKLRITLEAVKP